MDDLLNLYKENVQRSNGYNGTICSSASWERPEPHNPIATATRPPANASTDPYGTDMSWETALDCVEVDDDPAADDVTEGKAGTSVPETSATNVELFMVQGGVMTVFVSTTSEHWASNPSCISTETTRGCHAAYLV